MEAPSGGVVDDISLIPGIKDRFDGPTPFGLINASELNWITGPRVLLGSGTYGSVYKYDESSFGKVAVKFIKHNGDLRSDIVSEVALLRSIDDPNVINIKEIFLTPEFIGIVLPLATTTLDVVIKKGRIPEVPPNRPSFPLDNEDIIDSLLYQILRGIIATQDANIFNGDYKPANILVFNEPSTGCVTAQIADFGIAQPDSCYGGLIREFAFTRFYRPPEILLKEIVVSTLVPAYELENKEVITPYRRAILDSFYNTYSTLQNIPFGYTRASDAWAYGCIVTEILFRRALFAGDTDFDTMKKIIELTGTSNPMSPVPVSFSKLITEMKKWYSLYLIITGSVVLNRPRTEDFPLYSIISTTKYRKYIPLIMRLLSFYPSDRPDLRSVVNDPIFMNVRRKLISCLPEPEQKLQRSRDINIYCLRYLIKYQFPPISRNPILIVKIRIYLMYYMERIVQFFTLSDRTKARALQYMFIFAARDLEESSDNNDWIITQYEGFCLSAVLLASRFEDKGSLQRLVEFSEDKYDARFIFIGALKIFASTGFDLFRSTCYDILAVMQFFDSDRLSNMADILLDLTYFTPINTNYTSMIIVESIRKMVSIIGKRNIDITEANEKVDRCIISFIDYIELLINIGGLLDTPLSNFDRGLDSDGSSVTTIEVINQLGNVKAYLNNSKSLSSTKTSKTTRKRV